MASVCSDSWGSPIYLQVRKHHWLPSAPVHPLLPTCCETQSLAEIWATPASLCAQRVLWLEKTFQDHRLAGAWAHLVVRVHSHSPGGAVQRRHSLETSTQCQVSLAKSGSLGLPSHLAVDGGEWGLTLEIQFAVVLTLPWWISSFPCSFTLPPWPQRASAFVSPTGRCKTHTLHTSTFPALWGKIIQ